MVYRSEFLREGRGAVRALWVRIEAKVFQSKDF